MRLAAIFLVVMAIAVAGCPQLQGAQQLFGWNQTSPTTGTASISTPDVSMVVKVAPTEVRGGRPISTEFYVTNVQQAEDLRNVKVTVYDKCVFTGQSEDEIDPLKANYTKMFRWSWESPVVEFDRDCRIGFRTAWTGSLTATSDIAALSQVEYDSREQAGTLGEIVPYSTSTSAPIQIGLRFSDPQPFRSGDSISLFIDYTDGGSGFIGDLPAGAVDLAFPNNVKDITCNDFDTKCVGTVECKSMTNDKANCGFAGCTYNITSGECSGTPTVHCSELSNSRSGCEVFHCTWKYSLNRAKTFFNRRASPSTCTFTIDAKGPIDTQTLVLNATYDYSLDGSFNVLVKPR